MLTSRRGFTLVELLVVMAISGIIVTVVLGLYINVMRSTVSSEEVVEVQQGLRIALEQVARDIKMSGFLIPTNNPITEAGNDRIEMVTSSAFNSFARIGEPDSTNPDTEFPAGSATPITINVGNAAMARLFSVGSFARIVQPDTGNQLGTFEVQGVNTSSLRLQPLTAPGAAIPLRPGDFIVQVPSPSIDATYPNVVTYMLEDDPASDDPELMVLSRTWRLGTPTLTTDQKTIATNITDLRFEYIMTDGSVESSVTTAIQLENIIAVRIFLTGLTEERKTGGSKTRELRTTVKLRNI